MDRCKYLNSCTEQFGSCLHALSFLSCTHYLQTEIDRLECENEDLKDAMGTVCHGCHLKQENIELREYKHMYENLCR